MKLKLDKIVPAVVVAGVIVGVVVWPVTWESTNETVTCTVTKTDRTAKSDGGSDSRVYTKDCGVLAVGDDSLRLHFDSADVYSALEPGHRYEFSTVGFRFPLFSIFPNILKATDAE